MKLMSNKQLKTITCNHASLSSYYDSIKDSLSKKYAYGLEKLTDNEKRNNMTLSLLLLTVGRQVICLQLSRFRKQDIIVYLPTIHLQGLEQFISVLKLKNKTLSLSDIRTTDSGNFCSVCVNATPLTIEKMCFAWLEEEY